MTNHAYNCSMETKMAATGFVEYKNQQWHYEMSCGCDHCKTFIQTAIVEARVFSNVNECTLTIRNSNGIHGTITVDCWS